ncbi:MAG TPA: carboxypeptidase-like regulatory domain-containing protein [Burkholderiales bacterium]|nr:carboxypeptidase-like regulatory domain-containing protein [Burkholderiales bacterium]
MKLASLLIVAGAALAGSTAFAAISPRDAAAKLPAETIQGNVRYVSGGIGLEQANAFRKAGRHYALSLLFADKAKPRNEFTADVKVEIRDAKSNAVLDTVSTGPFLLAKLPAGRYDIKATQGGKTLERRVTVVEGKPAHVGFLWPST